MNLRHGDLIFTKVNELPQNLKKVFTGKKFIIAEGEYTGHKHVVEVIDRENTEFDLYQDTQGNYILDLKTPAQLTHQEHKTITFAPGIYIQEFEQEFDYFTKSINQVRD